MTELFRLFTVYRGDQSTANTEAAISRIETLPVPAVVDFPKLVELLCRIVGATPGR